MRAGRSKHHDINTQGHRRCSRRLCWPCRRGTALAHTGLEHATSFSSGFLHPLTGPDHVLAMVAVGLWAGINGGRAVWAWPVAFVSLMLVGGALGMTGVALPLVEPGILASVIVLGLLVLTAARVPVAVGALWSACSPCCTAMRMAPSCPGRSCHHLFGGLRAGHRPAACGGPRHRLPVGREGAACWRAPPGPGRRRRRGAGRI